MGWVPTKEDILEEAKNYAELSFFGKSKNQLASFVLATSVLTALFVGELEAMVGSGVLYEVIFNLVLVVFIYFNHRWAMVLFCAGYLFSKVTYLFIFAGSPISQLIFGAIALILTYSSLRVATQLKTKAKM